jgi:hypothetical protein
MVKVFIEVIRLISNNSYIFIYNIKFFILQIMKIKLFKFLANLIFKYYVTLLWSFHNFQYFFINHIF